MVRINRTRPCHRFMNGVLARIEMLGQQLVAKCDDRPARSRLLGDSTPISASVSRPSERLLRLEEPMRTNRSSMTSSFEWISTSCSPPSCLRHDGIHRPADGRAMSARFSRRIRRSRLPPMITFSMKAVRRAGQDDHDFRTIDLDRPVASGNRRCRRRRDIGFPCRCAARPTGAHRALGAWPAACSCDRPRPGSVRDSATWQPASAGSILTGQRSPDRNAALASRPWRAPSAGVRDRRGRGPHRPGHRRLEVVNRVVGLPSGKPATGSTRHGTDHPSAGPSDRCRRQRPVVSSIDHDLLVMRAAQRMPESKRRWMRAWLDQSLSLKSFSDLPE